jgi:GNAT superfamily N-acetyltransferase
LTEFLQSTYTPAIQSAEILDQHIITTVVLDGEEMAAYMMLRPNNTCNDIKSAGPCMQVQRFYVDIPYHGAGVSHLLMDAVMKEAKLHGQKTLWLGVWYLKFIQGIKFQSSEVL